MLGLYGIKISESILKYIFQNLKSHTLERQDIPVVISTSCGSRNNWVILLLCHFFAMRFYAGFLTSLCLSFLLCKKAIITLPTSHLLTFWGLKGILPIKYLAESLAHGNNIWLSSNITVFLIFLFQFPITIFIIIRPYIIYLQLCLYRGNLAVHFIKIMINQYMLLGKAAYNRLSE